MFSTNGKKWRELGRRVKGVIRVACHVHERVALVSKDASRLSALSQSVRNRPENRPVAKRETKVFGETATQYDMATPCRARAANSASLVHRM